MGWEQFDVFMRGDTEPSCSDLRKMWKLAKKLHNVRASKTTVTRDVKDDSDVVYGIVRTHVPTTTTTTTTKKPPRKTHMRVRDPAKEILSLLKQRSAMRRRQRLRQQRKQVICPPSYKSSNFITLVAMMKFLLQVGIEEKSQ